ncbi:unnamed protein product [Closterium sp. NIES-65]|nr:unnamed protein product [Closterium sp. NIES-65]
MPPKTEQESAEQNHMCARYEKALDSFLSCSSPPPHLSSSTEQESAEQNHMCARYEKALDSFVSTPTTPALEPAAAVEPDLLFVFARKKQTPLDSDATARPNPELALEPDLLFVFARKKQTPLDSDVTEEARSRPKSRPPWLQWTLVAQLALRLSPSPLPSLLIIILSPHPFPPWLQWTLVAQLALPPLTLTTALHEIRAAATDTATDSADNPAAIHDAGSTAGAAGEVNTGRAATGAAIATGSASSDSPAAAAAAAVASDSAGVWFSSQKMDEHVQRWLMGRIPKRAWSDWFKAVESGAGVCVDRAGCRGGWLMGRIPKRAWSDVAQCVAWYRRDLVFARHPSFESLSQSQSNVLVSGLKQALGLPAAATRAAVLAAYEAATWRQQASILCHVARLQLSADWDLLGLSDASAGGYIVTGDGDNRSGDNSDGDSNEDEWGEQDQTEEDEEDEGESGEEGEGGDSEAEEGEEEDEDLVWSEAEEQRALARDAEMLKQQGGQGITSQRLLGEGLTGGGDIDVLAGGGGAATAGAAGERNTDGSISDGGDELSVMERTLVRKKEEAAGEVKAAVGPFDSVRLIGELTLLHAIESGEETF